MCYNYIIVENDRKRSLKALTATLLLFWIYKKREPCLKNDGSPSPKALTATLNFKKIDSLQQNYGALPYSPKLRHLQRPYKLLMYVVTRGQKPTAIQG